MTEHTLVDACQDQLTRALPGCFLWKINDRNTGGIPDLEVDWHGATTKIEFKFLKGNETIHDKWEDERQPITCARLEEQTGRCWVVAFQAPSRQRELAHTLIYRPTTLLRGNIPEVKTDITDSRRWACRLWEEGVIRFPGYNYAAVVSLIQQTHL